MAQRFRRTRYTLAALALAVSAALFGAQPANADTIINFVDNNTPLRGCPNASSCSPVGNLVAGGSRVKDFCKVGSSNLIYTGTSDGRGGFVSGGALFIESQDDNCDAVGQAGVINRGVSLRACASNNCSQMGTSPPSRTAGLFCSLTGEVVGGNSTWVLIYADPPTNRGGFVPRVALDTIGTPGSCNSGL